MITYYDKNFYGCVLELRKTKERMMKMLKQNAMAVSEYDSGVLKIKLTGEIDHHNAMNLRTKIDEDIFLYRPIKVELLLGSVDFMDSSGLGLIIGRHEKAAEVGGKLVLKNPTKRIERVLSLAGIERIIKIERN